MHRINIRVFQKINGKYRAYIVGLVVVLLLISIIFAYKAMKQSLYREEKLIKNTIEEKLSFDYAPLAKPSTLYPNGGKVASDMVIFTNLTDKLIIKLDGSLNTELPVSVEGSTSVSYSLVAKDMWEREFIVVPTVTTKTEGISHSMLKEEIQINIQELLDYIKIVEEETLVRPNYLVVIKPKINGVVYQGSDGVIHEINSNLEIPFEISGQYIKYVGEIKENELININVLKDLKTIPLYYEFFGNRVSIITARYVFSIMSIILLILLLIYIIERAIWEKGKGTEVNIIDKRYKNKIITILDKFDLENIPQLCLDSFKTLLQISEEKEEPILKYTDDTEGFVYYYVLGTTVMYYYKVFKNIVDEGSEVPNDA